MYMENFRIMVVDEEKDGLHLIRKTLDNEGYSVKLASNVRDALNIFKEFKPHLIITELKVPNKGGISLIKSCKKINNEVNSIILTAYGNIEIAVESMKMGGIDYLTKPFDRNRLISAVKSACEKKTQMDNDSSFKVELEDDMPPLEIVFAGMEEMLDTIKKAASTDTTIMLYGETGTGKSLIAKVIHRLSKRKGPFIETSCAAVPENLLESEFFGYEKGAFTDASSLKKGKFEIAMDGTIFLDEVTEMNQSTQAKLLRVLEDGKFERLGGVNPIKTNARFICATNEDLKKEVARGRFREDLYYRLNVFPICLKSLRERKYDIPIFTNYFIRTISAAVGKKIACTDTGVLYNLISYHWPGNIRELRNVIERAIILTKSETIDISDISIPVKLEENALEGTLEEIEKRAIEHTLKKTAGHRKKTAELLGISLRTLQYKIKRYKLANNMQKLHFNA